jgi:hypothetical protein
MDISYYGHNIAVKVCYPSIDKCNFYCVWGLHLNMIYEMINNRMKFKELQFEKLEESKELITDKKDIKSNDKCYPALPVKKDKYYSHLPLQKESKYEKKLLFTSNDLVDMYQKICFKSRMKMSREIYELNNKNKNYLKRNIDLYDELKMIKLRPKQILQCEQCHNVISFNKCKKCIIKNSTILKNYYY